MTRSSWGQYSLFELKNSKGYSIFISDLGASIIRAICPDKFGVMADVVLGYDTPEEYLMGQHYIGGVVGPWANRIANGCFEVKGKKIHLEKNEGNNHLHGGSAGLHLVKWNVISFEDNKLTLKYTSKKNIAGYPSDIDIIVDYKFNEQSELEINYQAKASEITPINLTVHPYFNLTGDFYDAKEHILTINANEYLAVDEFGIPKSKEKVDGTSFDFRYVHNILERIDFSDQQIELMNGFDHCWVVRGTGFRFAAELYEPISGRMLTVFTDQPGIQFYSGQHLDGVSGKYGDIYQRYSGFCLETERYPDQPNSLTAEESLLFPNEIYSHRIIYKFGLHAK